MLCVDEKSQVQALACTSPVEPMMPWYAERRTHDHVRHGVTNLFAAFNIADGTVTFSIHRRHRADVPHISAGLSGQLSVLCVGGGREAE
jgi:hypothetical protein